MANTPGPQMLEGQSTNRMTLYIKAQDYHVWRVIANGPHVPTKTVDGQKVPKLESEWNDNDVKCIELNCKAMSSLYFHNPIFTPGIFLDVDTQNEAARTKPA